MAVAVIWVVTMSRDLETRITHRQVRSERGSQEVVLIETWHHATVLSVDGNTRFEIVLAE